MYKNQTFLSPNSLSFSIVNTGRANYFRSVIRIQVIFIDMTLFTKRRKETCLKKVGGENESWGSYLLCVLFGKITCMILWQSLHEQWERRLSERRHTTDTPVRWLCIVFRSATNADELKVYLTEVPILLEFVTLLWLHIPTTRCYVWVC